MELQHSFSESRPITLHPYSNPLSGQLSAI